LIALGDRPISPPAAAKGKIFLNIRAEGPAVKSLQKALKK
jgi:hypothetical protein